MGLDDVHNAPIALVYPVQSATFSFPHEEITLVGTGDDELIIWSDKVYCKDFIVSNQVPPRTRIPYRP